MTGNQAMQQVKAGLKAIYFPDGRWPPTPMWPEKCIDQSCIRSIRSPRWCAGSTARSCVRIRFSTWRATATSTFAPIVADAERDLAACSTLRVDEGYDRPGAAGVHFEDQLASVKSAGTWAAKVLVPTRGAVESWSRHGSLPTAWACRRSFSRAPTPRPPPGDVRHRRQRQAVLHR